MIINTMLGCSLFYGVVGELKGGGLVSWRSDEMESEALYRITRIKRAISYN